MASLSVFNEISVEIGRESGKSEWPIKTEAAWGYRSAPYHAWMGGGWMDDSVVGPTAGWMGWWVYA